MKKVKFLWFRACEKSFQELKTRLTLAPILTLHEGLGGFVLSCNASRIGLGCVFMQNGKFITYASRHLKANVVTNVLSRLSMNSVAHIEVKKNKLVLDVYRLSRYGVPLVYLEDEGVIVHNGSESSLVSDVDGNRIMIQL
ncbi:hypothetical protein MTR67_018294 [Solanum verrucosum]|uniref:Reverse transcriptase/retrotransposon-derived protein RNase H-like domain-containing protein n=1 Tax=Solanum verrucosum TaxID=315347 RepID=A0AAF0TMK1_SOLVR|nr:hypothetical protein MTR67_018294 [Solanum verrucosum]